MGKGSSKPSRELSQLTIVNAGDDDQEVRERHRRRYCSLVVRNFGKRQKRFIGVTFTMF